MISLSGISITCFAASYLVALALEVSRLFFRASIRTIITRFWAVAGMIAHTSYLLMGARSEFTEHGLIPLASWSDFCLLAAWLLAGAYVGLALRRPQNSVGIFLLPLVLALVGLAVAASDLPRFGADAATSIWGAIHGFTLLLGTTAVALGCATGIMYLIQGYRLKQKLPPREGFRLPSLEWLQRFNRETLLLSTLLLFLGLISGVVLNVASHVDDVEPRVSWTDPVVLSSAVLFGWLLVVTLFEILYRPARQGQKVAYLTLASFLFLLMALSFVLFGEHAVRVSSQATRIDLAGRLSRGIPVTPGRMAR